MYYGNCFYSTLNILTLTFCGADKTYTIASAILEGFNIGTESVSSSISVATAPGLTL